MNTIDIVILIILILFGLRGVFRGIILEIFTLLGLIVAYIVAVREMSTVSGWIDKYLNLPDLVITSLAFLLIFLIIGFLFRWVARLLQTMAKWTIIRWIDKGGGILFGLFKGAIVSSLLIMLMSVLPFVPEIEKECESSLLWRPVKSVAPAVFNFIIHTFPEAKTFYEEVQEGFRQKARPLQHVLPDSVMAEGAEKIRNIMQNDTLETTAGESGKSESGHEF